MSNTYGYVKCKVVSSPVLKATRRKHEVQYHLHVNLQVDSGQGSQTWDTAINVGTNDSDDLLRYRLAFDFNHPVLNELKNAAPGFHDLTGTKGLPALDFLRSDILANTGAWRDSSPMDGSGTGEPNATLKRLLLKAQDQKADVYIFGRTYKGGDLGIHNVHMNQGSAAPFLNDGVHDDTDHNDVWQDGAVLVDLGEPEWSAYFTAFTQQNVPTDALGNPENGSHEIDEADDGSMI